jgi:monoamine oxidase
LWGLLLDLFQGSKTHDDFMNRRQFIGLAPHLAFGTLLPPISPGSGQRKRESVVIVGAGIAGLYLGQKLRKYGFEVKILEAKSQVGGRIADNLDFHSHALDLGAQWIHGKNSLYKLAFKNNVPVYRDHKNDAIKVLYSNSLLEDLPQEAYDFFQFAQKKSTNTARIISA